MQNPKATATVNFQTVHRLMVADPSLSRPRRMSPSAAASSRPFRGTASWTSDWLLGLLQVNHVGKTEFNVHLVHDIEMGLEPIT